jgi:hypothetical protein
MAQLSRDGVSLDVAQPEGTQVGSSDITLTWGRYSVPKPLCYRS